jgi:hypothetical protein
VVCRGISLVADGVKEPRSGDLKVVRAVREAAITRSVGERLGYDLDRDLCHIVRE